MIEVKMKWKVEIYNFVLHLAENILRNYLNVVTILE